MMLLSFLVLTLTGLPLRYSEWAISSWWMARWGGIDITRWVHRYAAWVMIAVCVYHLLYLLVKRPFSTAMIPKLGDVRDFIADMRHTFRLSKESPRFDRYSYRNKAAYWLTAAGAVLIILSGFVLMYPVGSSEHLGAWAYPFSLIVHSDTAVIATAWILFVHVYYAHFAKHVFPMDKGIFTGKVKFDRYREEFPLEFERIMKAAGVPYEVEEPKTPKAETQEPETGESSKDA